MIIIIKLVYIISVIQYIHGSGVKFYIEMDIWS